MMNAEQLSWVGEKPVRSCGSGDPFEIARQAVSLCDFCAADLAAMQCPTFCKQFRSGGTMNAAVHTAAAQKRSIGSIEDCINTHFCNIVSDNLQRHEAYPIRQINALVCLNIY